MSKTYVFYAEPWQHGDLLEEEVGYPDEVTVEEVEKDLAEWLLSNVDHGFYEKKATE